MTGEELKKLRLEKGFTQQDLAEKIGTHKQVISRWERGKGNISKAYEILLSMVLR